MEIKEIYKIWRSTLELADTDKTKAIFREVVDHYCEPHRHYHNLDHVGNLLELIETTVLTSNERRILIHAALFHDVIYNTSSSKNESLSAQYANEALNYLSVPKEEIKSVCHIIQATSDHSSDDILAQLFLDMDMAILGSPKLIYKEYKASIRREWSNIPDTFYCIGRTKFLIKQLVKKSIFYTPKFQRLFENQARNNIRNEIINVL